MHSFRFLRSWLMIISFFAAAGLRAADFSGVYENAGNLVSADTSQASGSVSFQGLLELNFDYVLARALHSETSQVTLRQTATHFIIECRDVSSKVTWSGRWEKGVGYSAQEDRVELTFHNASLKYDSYVLALQPIPQRDLLFVEVRRMNATYLGPSVQPVGSFLFARVARE